MVKRPEGVKCTKKKCSNRARRNPVLLVGKDVDKMLRPGEGDVPKTFPGRSESDELT